MPLQRVLLEEENISNLVALDLFLVPLTDHQVCGDSGRAAVGNSELALWCRNR